MVSSAKLDSYRSPPGAENKWMKSQTNKSDKGIK
jgi:hypothetical protein